MSTFINASTIPLLAEVDILVIGAGSAGSVAAITAGYYHKGKVMLIERYGFPGGTSTQMLDTFYGFFTPGETPKKIVGGVPDTVVNRLKVTGDIFLRPNTYGAGTGINYNPERLKLVWDQLIEEAGIKYLLHTTLVEVQPGEAEGIHTCVIYNKGGFFKIKAKRVIDASGDADFCKQAGHEFELAGEKEPAQSMTTTFRMSNVDLEAYQKAGGKKMLMEKMESAVGSGRHPLPRKQGSAHEMVQAMCISTVAVKVTDLRADRAEEFTQAEIEGRRQAFIYEKFFREEVPGYENAKIIGLSHQIGVRETRRVYGMERLSREDCLSGKIPQTSILLCGAPIEDHKKSEDGGSETVWEYIPGDGVYGVPYGTIVPQKSQITWVVGRCFSATHDAHASCRSMGQTMSMGQAAGLAACISLDDNLSAPEIPVAKLQDKLQELGAILQVPMEKADTSRNGWSNNLKNL
ncbi:FAD-dependent oxidoreductase [Pleomorphovibrio marinus]|uniref:FAD-dependent oxidoreductase n=1 Tax=Pleomorphovibrio marinus TaxID=2164132 RepID=UPI000E0A92AD|nr:FAD-dependent oxidoreductase [Pleomorphovibrio marinus]